MQDSIKNKIEAILFTLGRAITSQQISELIHYNKIDEIESTLQDLKQEYSQKNSSLEIIQDEKFYRMNIKPTFMPLVKSLMPRTELERPIISTLALIAWKQPILQSRVVKMRGNTAYEHVKLLEEHSFIKTKKSGLSKLITLSQKFYEYFDTNQDNLKSKLQEAKEKVPEKITKEIPDLLKDV